MPRFNANFDLTIGDIDLIETALREREKVLSLRRIALLSATGAEEEDLTRLDTRLAEVQDLLGRLHNQKIFYRPVAANDAPYIGG